MPFAPGQQVVCIDDTPMVDRVFTLKSGRLKRGAIYTIRDYVRQADWISPLFTNEPCVRLVEIVRRYDCLGFRESRFQPLEKLKRQIARRKRKKVPV